MHCAELHTIWVYSAECTVGLGHFLWFRWYVIESRDRICSLKTAFILTTTDTDDWEMIVTVSSTKIWPNFCRRNCHYRPSIVCICRSQNESGVQWANSMVQAVCYWIERWNLLTENRFHSYYDRYRRLRDDGDSFVNKYLAKSGQASVDPSEAWRDLARYLLTKLSPSSLKCLYLS